MHYLGILYERQRRFEEAFQQYERAAADGITDAEAAVGRFYLQGIGVTPSDKNAEEFLKRAADKGDSRATYNLGILYEKQRRFEEAFHCYQSAAADPKMMPEATSAMGGLYFDAKEYRSAEDCYKKAADKGYRKARYNLGACCEKQGRFEEAFQHYQTAAIDYEDTNAEFALGDCYKDGIGVIQNYELAEKFLKKAADKGNLEAQNNLRMCRERRRKFEKAFQHYAIAADPEIPEAEWALGDCYLHGIGVAQDFKLAEIFLEKAAAKKNLKAQYSLKECYEKQGRFEEAANLPEYLQSLDIGPNPNDSQDSEHRISEGWSDTGSEPESGSSDENSTQAFLSAERASAI